MARTAAQIAYAKTPAGKAKKRLYRNPVILRNRAFVVAYKMESGCVDCGYRLHPDALEFDHVPGRGDKSFCLHQTSYKSLSLEAIAREIEKCEVVCANCHRIRTAIRRKGEA